MGLMILRLARTLRVPKRKSDQKFQVSSPLPAQRKEAKLSPTKVKLNQVDETFKRFRKWRVYAKLLICFYKALPPKLNGVEGGATR